MSYARARQRSTEAAEQPHEHSNRCAANGCPLRGTIAPSGGRFICSFHYAAQPEDWSRVTEGLHVNEKLRLAIDEVLRIGDMEWCMGKWQMMERFFDGEPELQPTVAEHEHRRWYEYRLHNWLMHLSGVTKRKPVPREPLQPNKRRGNIGSLLGGA
jgi:hypothetical protein